MDFREQRPVSRHAHVKMSWIKHEVYKNSPQFSVTIHQTTTDTSQGIKISPAILFIIIILAVLFFISGLLHLLVRFLTKYHASSSTAFHQPNNRYTHGSATHDTLQRQLQQLFNMNDSGLDQAFIDALPVFMYKEIVGAKESFDCAVCLCEFCEMDKLRLLPACSHAFHIECIDTWLVSNSTCPLCRNALFSPGISMDNPVFEFDDMREAEERRLADGLKTTDQPEQLIAEKGVFMVRLGKFRRLITEGDQKDSGETSSRKLDARRCYSMGSYEYVVGDTSLKLALNDNRESRDRGNGKIVEGEELGDGNLKVNDDTEGKKISMSAKTDSYSVSKIWLWSKKGKLASSSENQVHNPSSVDMELPWMGRMRGT